MLKIVDFTQKRNSASGCVMLLGGFDGLHIGHKKLMETAKTYALPIGVMTILGGKAGLPLFTAEERAEIFAREGADFMLELPFAEIRELSPNAFLNLLKEKFSPKVFVCGDDFRFGKDACGSAEILKTAGQVCVETLCRLDGEKVSATAVKRFLTLGNMEKANAFLGENYFLIGKVYKDRGVGKTLGFPTANIAYPKDKYPIKKGVYETRVTIGKATYKGITNYGHRPTFNENEDCTETYLDGFSGDLYGKTLKVEFVRYLRDIQKFESAEQLKAQLEKDIARVRND